LSLTTKILQDMDRTWLQVPPQRPITPITFGSFNGPGTSADLLLRWHLIAASPVPGPPCVPVWAGFEEPIGRAFVQPAGELRAVQVQTPHWRQVLDWSSWASQCEQTIVSELGQQATLLIDWWGCGRPPGRVTQSSLFPLKRMEFETEPVFPTTPRRRLL
jgi:hypothetical protein